MIDKGKITIGADPEVVLINKRSGDSISAGRTKYNVTAENVKIGKDGGGFLLEFRPTPSSHVFQAVYNLKELINEVYGNGYLISINSNSAPAGYHIHFGTGDKVNITQVSKYLHQALFLPLAHLEPNIRRRSGYNGNSNSSRRQDWGFEYRSMPSTILFSPAVVTVVYSVAQWVVENIPKASKFTFSSVSDWLEWVDSVVLHIPIVDRNKKSLYLKNRLIDEMESFTNLTVADLSSDKVFKNWFDQELYTIAKDNKRKDKVEKRARMVERRISRSGVDSVGRALHHPSETIELVTSSIRLPRFSAADAWTDFPVEEVRAIPEFSNFTFIGLREDRGLVVALPQNWVQPSERLHGMNTIPWLSANDIIGIPYAWRVGLQPGVREVVIQWFRDLAQWIHSGYFTRLNNLRRS